MGIIEDIKKAYYIVNEKLVSEQNFNDQKSRHEVILILLDLLKDSEVGQIRIVCDETNNTPKIIDNNQMVARVQWRVKNRFDKEVKYVDLYFGHNAEVVWE